MCSTHRSGIFCTEGNYMLALVPTQHFDVFLIKYIVISVFGKKNYSNPVVKYIQNWNINEGDRLLLLYIVI